VIGKQLGAQIETLSASIGKVDLLWAGTQCHERVQKGPARIAFRVKSGASKLRAAVIQHEYEVWPFRQVREIVRERQICAG
jgi:hypothetical protein